MQELGIEKLNAKRKPVVKKVITSSGCTGVYFVFSSKTWRSTSRTKGKWITHGTFKTLLDAACARKSYDAKMEALQ